MASIFCFLTIAALAAFVLVLYFDRRRLERALTASQAKLLQNADESRKDARDREGEAGVAIKAIRDEAFEVQNRMFHQMMMLKGIRPPLPAEALNVPQVKIWTRDERLEINDKISELVEHSYANGQPLSPEAASLRVWNEMGYSAPQY
jgi:hypothetical protein